MTSVDRSYKAWASSADTLTTSGAKTMYGNLPIGDRVLRLTLTYFMNGKSRLRLTLSLTGTVQRLVADKNNASRRWLRENWRQMRPVFSRQLRNCKPQGKRIGFVEIALQQAIAGGCIAKLECLAAPASLEPENVSLAAAACTAGVAVTLGAQKYLTVNKR